MVAFRLEVDAPNCVVIALITDEDGTEHDYEFDYEPTSGSWDFEERDILEEDYGAEWVEEFEEAIQGVIDVAAELTLHN